MSQKLILLVLFVFAVMFTRDAVRFPHETDLSRSDLTVVVSPVSFSKGMRELHFEGVEGSFPIRCDLNQAICADPQRFGGKPVALEVIRTSWLGQYLAIAKTQDGYRVSYVQAVSKELPKASQRAWVWPIMLWLAVLFYGLKVYLKLK